jgi:hypothetical protein
MQLELQIHLLEVITLTLTEIKLEGRCTQQQRHQQQGL